jgi:cysteine-rich repeat protein
MLSAGSSREPRAQVGRTAPTLLLIAGLSVLTGCPTDWLLDDGLLHEALPTPRPTPTPVLCPATDLTELVDGDTLLGSTALYLDRVDPSCGILEAGDRLFQFTAPESARYAISTAHPGTDYDTLLYAFSDCLDPEGSELGCNDDQVGEQSRLVLEAEAGETIYFVVDGSGDTGSFELSVRTAACGDGVVSGNEHCDDGNTAAGDGCDADCLWECVDDGFEDNDDLSSAADLDAVSNPAEIDAVLCPSDTEPTGASFADWYRVEVASGEALLVRVEPDGGDCNTGRFQLELIDSALNVLERVSSDGQSCLSLNSTPGVGTFRLRLSWTDPTVGPQAYHLSVRHAEPVCGNGIAEGDEFCDDGNAVSGDGCSTLCNEEDPACTILADLSANIDGSTFIGNTQSSPSNDHEASCALERSNDKVLTVTAASDTALELSTDHAGSAFDTLLHVRTDCWDPTTEIACNDDDPNAQYQYRSRLDFNATAGVTYYVIVSGYNTSSGAFEISATTQ